MSDLTSKAALLRYLQAARDAMLWKLDGLSEYDVRRPITPTGTNLLGLVKHLTGVELGYFGVAFDRLPIDPPGFWAEDAEDNADMWATAEESRRDVVGRYRQAWGHADATIAAVALEAEGTVPWWPAERRQASLHTLLVHVVAETHRHAGHADIVRELIDGHVGLRAGSTNIPRHDAAWWQRYRARLEEAAHAWR